MSVATGKIDKPKHNLNKVKKQNMKKGVKVSQTLNAAKKFNNKSNKMTAQKDSIDEIKLQTGKGNAPSPYKNQKDRQKTKLQTNESKNTALIGTGKNREMKKLKRLAEGKPAVNQSKAPAAKAPLSKSAKRRQRREGTVGKEIGNQKLQNEIWVNDTKKCEKRLQEIHSKPNVKTEAASSDELDNSESDYEVEHMVKADKITKKLSAEVGTDSDEDSGDVEDDSMLMESEENDDDGDDTMSVSEAESADDSNESSEETDKKPQMKKLNLVNKVDGKAVVEKAGKTEGKQTSSKIARYVVFVGNLPYSVDKSTLEEHFSKAGEISDVRIALEKGTNKPRGFAYVELLDSVSYQKALSLHHTMVGGRRINVQYTQPGHKKSPQKKKQVKAKNFKLTAMRKQGKLAGSTKPGQNRTARRNKAKGKNSEKSA